jgi:tetratricopeptide (TPR) repeat protein
MARALADFNEAIRLAPTQTAPYINRGGLLAERGEYEKAIADFSEVIRRNLPRIQNAYYARGRIYLMQGCHVEALADLNQAIARKSDFAEAFIRRAGIENYLGHLEEAIADYETAGRLVGENAQACNELAWALAANSEPRFRNGQKALQYAKRACELTQWANASFIDTLAVAYAEAGDFSEAIRYQKTAVAMIPETAPYRDDVLKHLSLFEQNLPYHEAEGR